VNVHKIKTWKIINDRDGGNDEFFEIESPDAGDAALTALTLLGWIVVEKIEKNGEEVSD